MSKFARKLVRVCQSLCPASRRSRNIIIIAKMISRSAASCCGVIQLFTTDSCGSAVSKPSWTLARSPRRRLSHGFSIACAWTVRYDGQRDGVETVAGSFTHRRTIGIGALVYSISAGDEFDWVGKSVMQACRMSCAVAMAHRVPPGHSLHVGRCAQACRWTRPPKCHSDAAPRP